MTKKKREPSAEKKKDVSVVLKRKGGWGAYTKTSCSDDGITRVKKVPDSHTAVQLVTHYTVTGWQHTQLLFCRAPKQTHGAASCTDNFVPSKRQRDSMTGQCLILAFDINVDTSRRAPLPLCYMPYLASFSLSAKL